jgi:predicted nuclease with TOPRIM domain
MLVVNSIAVVCMLGFVLATLPGCKDDNKLETTRGLEEENRVLRDQISTLQKRLDEESERRTQLGGERDAEFQQIRDRFNALQREASEAHRRELAMAKNEASDLRLRLSNSEKQVIALTEALYQPDRVRAAKSESFMIERTVYAALIVGLVATIVFVLKSRTDKRLERVERLPAAIRQLSRGTQS